MIHDLLPLAKYSDLPTGAELATWGRTAWTFTARLSRPAALAPAASVIIESSPRAGDDAEWSEVATLALADTNPANQTATLPVTERYLRARVTGDAAKGATFWVTADAPFVLTTGDDAALFGKELRQWSDGFARTVAEAERTVLQSMLTRTASPMVGTPQFGPFIPDPSRPVPGNTTPIGVVGNGVPVYTPQPVPVIDFAFDAPGAVDALRMAIVHQAEHSFRRYRLAQSNDASATVTLRQLAEMAPGVSALLAPYRSRAIDAWRGR